MNDEVPDIKSSSEKIRELLKIQKPWFLKIPSVMGQLGSGQIATIFGGSGSGKSLMALSLVREAVASGKKVSVLTVEGLSRDFLSDGEIRKAVNDNQLQIFGYNQKVPVNQIVSQFEKLNSNLNVIDNFEFYATNTQEKNDLVKEMQAYLRRSNSTLIITSQETRSGDIDSIAVKNMSTNIFKSALEKDYFKVTIEKSRMAPSNSNKTFKIEKNRR